MITSLRYDHSLRLNPEISAVEGKSECTSNLLVKMLVAEQESMN